MRLCEALHAAGRINDAGKSLLELLSTFDEVISETMTNWVHGEFVSPRLFSCIQAYLSDFIRQCLSTPLTENSDDGMSTYTPLLKVWAKAISANGSWRDALISAGDVSVFFKFHLPHRLTLLVQSSRFPNSQSIGLYVNASKKLVV